MLLSATSIVPSIDYTIQKLDILLSQIHYRKFTDRWNAIKRDIHDALSRQSYQHARDTVEGLRDFSHDIEGRLEDYDYQAFVGGATTGWEADLFFEGEGDINSNSLIVREERQIALPMHYVYRLIKEMTAATDLFDSKRKAIMSVN